MLVSCDAGVRRRRQIILGWLGVLLVCTGLWGGEAILYHAEWADKRDRQARLDELTGLLDPYVRHPKLSVRKLETKLNGGRRFERLFSYGSSVTRYFWHPGALGSRFTGWRVELDCLRCATPDSTDEELMSYKTFAPPVTHDDSLDGARAEMETTRNIALLIGLGAWFVGMVTIFFTRPWRRQVAQVCMAGAIVAAVAWSVSPTRAWGRNSLVAPLPIGIASAALVSMLALIVPAPHRKRQASTPSCPGCGYNLTGNRSGICPECGRPTPQGLAERWQAQAERLLAIASDERLEAVDRQSPVSSGAAFI